MESRGPSHRPGRKQGPVSRSCLRGFLGIAETNSFIPIDAITRITSDEVRLDQKRDHVAEAPVYDPDLVEERDFYQNVYSYYGYAPYWTPGYIYPVYPFLPR